MKAIQLGEVYLRGAVEAHKMWVRPGVLVQLFVFSFTVVSVVWVLRSNLEASVQFASFFVLFVLVVLLTWPITDPLEE
ncbi:hypothetical protein JCM18750_32110 [Halostagnicola bangensis]